MHLLHVVAIEHTIHIQDRIHLYVLVSQRLLQPVYCYLVGIIYLPHHQSVVRSV